MGRTPRKPETDSQAMLMRRIQEELDRQQLSEAALARVAGMNQKTLNDIINGAVPKLTQVHKIAAGLGLHVSDLFRPSAQSQEITTGKVHYLPKPPPIFAKQQKDRTPGKTAVRNKVKS